MTLETLDHKIVISTEYPGKLTRSRKWKVIWVLIFQHSKNAVKIDLKYERLKLKESFCKKSLRLQDLNFVVTQHAEQGGTGKVISNFHLIYLNAQFQSVSHKSLEFFVGIKLKRKICGKMRWRNSLAQVNDFTWYYRYYK